MTVGQHRTIQWIAIALILLAGAGWYYRTQVRGSGTIGNDQVAFEAPLTASLDLAHGVGGPTFTRATVATVTDFEGRIKTVKSGEARFEGARRVENLIPTSSASLTSGSNKTVTVTAGTYVFSMGAGASAGVATFSGTGGASGTITQNASNRTSKNFTLTAGTFIITASVATLTNLQFEQTTGQTISTIPSEYISVGVKTAAPYHGANVDGVKYFSTQNGNTVVSNIVTEAIGSAIADGTLHGYVAEGARTNQLTRSEQMDDATAWVPGTVAMTVTSDYATAPSGSLTAEKFVPNTTSSGHYTFNNSSITTGTTYTQTVYAKAAGYNYIQILTSSGFDVTNSWVNYDLSTGLIGSKGNGSFTSSITALPNSWYKITMRATANTSVTGRFIFAVYNTDAARLAAYTGDGSSGMYLWGAQLEVGAFASSYIPTTTASVTRNADVLTYPSSGNFSDTAGSAYAEPIAESWTNAGGQYLGDGTEAPLQSSASSSGIQSYDGTNTVNGPTGTPTGQKKVASSWTGTTLKAFSTGVSGTAGTYDGAFTLAQLNIGSSFYGTIRNVKIWKKALTDGQLTNLTSATAAVSSSAVKKTTAKVPTKTGLVGYWSMDDGAGTKAGDASGQGITGTLSGGPTWVSGKLGQGLNFDGVDDYVDLGDVLNLSLPISVSAWVKLDTLPSPGGTSGIFTTDRTLTSVYNYSGIWLEVSNTGTVEVSFSDNTACGPGGRRSKDSVSTLSTGQWHHIVAVVQGATNMQLYIDGIDSGGTYTGTGGSIVNTTRSAAIGRVTACSSGAVNDTDGTIDEVRIYNRALSSAEVTTLYQSSAAKMNVSQNDKLTSGLVGQWSFNGPDVSGTTAYDRSGSGNNGTLTNGPTVTPGKVGQALNFDGVKGVFFASNAQNAETVSFWLKLNSDGNGAIIANGSDYFQSGDWDWSFFMYQQTLYARGNPGGYGGILAYTLGKWDHYVLVRSQGKVYQNGVLVVNNLDSLGGAIAGTGGTGTTFKLNGFGGIYASFQIDEVRIYNRTLSATEISELYLMGR